MHPEVAHDAVASVGRELVAESVGVVFLSCLGWGGGSWGASALCVGTVSCVTTLGLVSTASYLCAHKSQSTRIESPSCFPGNPAVRRKAAGSAFFPS